MLYAKIGILLNNLSKAKCLLILLNAKRKKKRPSICVGLFDLCFIKYGIKNQERKCLQFLRRNHRYKQ